MPFEFKEIGARVCQTIFFHTFFPSKTVRLTTTAGVSRVIIIDEGKRGKSSNTPVRSSTHPPMILKIIRTRVRVASTTTTAMITTTTAGGIHRVESSGKIFRI